MRKLLSTLAPPESNAIRVDFRSAYVHYLNNLEVDAMYKRWRSNLNEVHLNLCLVVYSLATILGTFDAFAFIGV